MPQMRALEKSPANFLPSYAPSIHLRVLVGSPWFLDPSAPAESYLFPAAATAWPTVNTGFQLFDRRPCLGTVSLTSSSGVPTRKGHVCAYSCSRGDQCNKFPSMKAQTPRKWLGQKPKIPYG